MTTSEPVFLDTNVLVYAINATVFEHNLAMRALAQLDANHCTLWISPQVIRETLRILLCAADFGQPETMARSC